MADVADAAIVVSSGTAVAAVVYAVRLTWKLSRIEKDIRDEVSSEVDNLQLDVAKIVRDHTEKSETIRHEFGEVAAALRTKIHDVEMWNRDTFVRKDSFEMVIGRLEKSIEKLGDKIEDRIDKMLERIQQRSE